MAIAQRWFGRCPAPLASPGDAAGAIAQSAGGGRYRHFSRRSTIALLSVAAAFAQCPTAPAFPASIATDTNLVVAGNGVTTTLLAPMQPSDSVAAVKSGTGWLAHMMASADSEIMFVTAVNGNLLTVARGCESTTAAAHAAAKAISNNVTAASHELSKWELEAVENALGTSLANVYARPPGTFVNGPALAQYIGQIGASTPVQMYQSGQEQSNLYANDGLEGVVSIPSTGTEWEGAGVFGGVQNASITTNAVAGRFYALATGAGTDNTHRVKIWGINTLLKDGTVATNYNFVELVNEWDYNINNPGTTLIAHSIGGASSVQPTQALGYTCNSLGAAKWDWCIGSLDGTSTVGAEFGAQSTGNNTNSQPIFMWSRSSGGTAYLSQLQGDAAGNFDITGITSVNFTAGGVGSVFTVKGTNVTAAVPIVFPAYGFAGLPAASASPYGTVICVACTANSSPCTSGGSNVFARSTGTQWGCGSF